MQTLVTGGTGFVGSHLVRALLDAGHRVRVLRRQTSKTDALEGLEYESAYGDLLDSEALRAACDGCDWVFHVAAVADYWRADQKRMFEINIEGSRRVTEAAHHAGVRRVVFTSSAAAMGIRKDGAPADENDAFNLPPHRFPYGYSKAIAERVVLEALDRGQEVVIVNPVVVMGPGDLNVISGGFVIQVKQRGAWVPMPPGAIAVVDVRDVARWHIAAAERGIAGERYLLGTENYAYPDWFALIADAVGAPRPAIQVPRAALAPMAALFDGLQSLGVKLPVDGNQTRLGGERITFRYDKAWNALGQPTIDMPQSVRETYQWYAAHGFV